MEAKLPARTNTSEHSDDKLQNWIEAKTISISHLIFQDVNKVTAARPGLFSFTYRLADIPRRRAKGGLKALRF
jgi:hypothetical protein